MSLNKIRKFVLDVNARLVKEVILKQTIWNKILHQINNNNGVRVVKFVASKNIAVKIQCSLIIKFIYLLGRFLIDPKAI
jgi:hypothetical protein